MGLLTEGKPLDWPQTEPYREKIKRDGVTQFLMIYEATKGRTGDVLKWGDEVEYMIVVRNEMNKVARLSLRAPALIPILQQEEHANIEGSTVEVLWRPEYANWMVEGTPGVPYRCFAQDLVLVEQNMALRRREIEKLLNPNEIVLSIPAYPRLGCGVHTEPPTAPLGCVSRSLYVSDDVINPHPRFPNLTRSVRLRRGGKVDIRLPVFQDENTPATFPMVPDDLDHVLAVAQPRSCKVQPYDNDTAYDSVEALADAETDDVYLDCMAFGMGACCLQVTLQARDIKESRMLYDHLAVLAPIFLALSAGTPIQKGFLLDTDVRWNAIAASVDDRTEEERNGLISKSRYDSISCYISDMQEMDPHWLNDIPVELNKDAFEQLTAAGIDDRLARHVAHLFVRDPVSVFEDHIDLDNSATTDHFENIQSTNWNTMRFKPPPVGSNIGWRVEFRSMDIQLTDFENAAFAIFTVLTSRVIAAYRLNLYIPMSKVDANMQTAHERGAVTSGTFFFRRNIFHDATIQPPESFLCQCGHMHHPKYSSQFNFACNCDMDSSALELMTVGEILNGILPERNGETQISGASLEKSFAFPGLIPLIKAYLLGIKVPEETKNKLFMYLDFISARASGKLLTLASWIRKFVEEHPEYAKDSRVSDRINYDLITALHEIEKGVRYCPEMFGQYYPGHRAQEINVDMMKELRSEVDESGSILHGQSLSMSAVNRTLATMARQQLTK
mmetsp:Transcript_14502/g.38788  ORF Transcript_14502/g.38788 Transcript_14502/m.38788 type:complete len:728 (+) Transcript_14502:137-2320(+)